MKPYIFKWRGLHERNKKHKKKNVKIIYLLKSSGFVCCLPHKAKKTFLGRVPSLPDYINFLMCMISWTLLLMLFVLYLAWFCFQHILLLSHIRLEKNLLINHTGTSAGTELLNSLPVLWWAPFPSEFKLWFPPKKKRLLSLKLWSKTLLNTEGCVWQYSQICI